MKINVRKGVQIDIRSDKSMYITIGDYTYYIDDSTGEQIIDFWQTNNPSVSKSIIYNSSEETFATMNKKASTVNSVVKKNLPLKPHQVYDEWISWADFLGINNK